MEIWEANPVLGPVPGAVPYVVNVSAAGVVNPEPNGS